MKIEVACTAYVEFDHWFQDCELVANTNNTE